MECGHDSVQRERQGRDGLAADKGWIFHFRNINSEIVFTRTIKWNF